MSKDKKRGLSDLVSEARSTQESTPDEAPATEAPVTKVPAAEAPVAEVFKLNRHALLAAGEYKVLKAIVPKKLHARVKAEVSIEDTDISEFVEMLLTRYFVEKDQSE